MGVFLLDLFNLTLKYLDVVLLIQVKTSGQRVIGSELNAIQLSIFSHRFMSTAEQMGRVLQRTSISTNIKVCLVMYSYRFCEWYK